MARKSVLWNIWKPATKPRFKGELSNVGRVHAWADTPPADVVEMFITQRQRLNSRPLGMNAADYTARHYPINCLDDWGN